VIDRSIADQRPDAGPLKATAGVEALKKLRSKG